MRRPVQTSSAPPFGSRSTTTGLTGGPSLWRWSASRLRTGRPGSARSSSTRAARAVRGWTSSSASDRLLFSDEVRERFDLVGFDPRGIVRSSPLICFRSFEEALAPFPPFAFPITPDEEALVARLDMELNSACQQRGGAIIDHMATADAARDLDVLRRAVGDASSPTSVTRTGHSWASPTPTCSPTRCAHWWSTACSTRSPGPRAAMTKRRRNRSRRVFAATPAPRPRLMSSSASATRRDPSAAPSRATRRRGSRLWPSDCGPGRSSSRTRRRVRPSRSPTPTSSGRRSER